MKKIYLTIFLAAALLGCKKNDDIDLGPAPTADFSYRMLNDNTVEFTNNSSGNFLLSWDFGNGDMSTERIDTIYYPYAGDYSVKLLAIGRGGQTNATKTINIASTDPIICNDTLLALVTGGCALPEGKKWVIDTAAGAFGNGPVDDTKTGPEWYVAPANAFADGCMYDQTYQFVMQNNQFIPSSTSGEGNVNWEWANLEFGQSQAQYADICLPQGVPSKTSFILSTDENGRHWLELRNGQWIGYYVKRSKYEILTITEDTMFLRFTSGMADGKPADNEYRYLRLIRKQ